MKRVDNELKFPLKGKYTAMIAPSFIVDFYYPEIIYILKKLGFNKIVELTFGAKIINREYHKILADSKELKIATVCPGVVEFIKQKAPQYSKNLIQIDSPMIAMSKVCKKIYPKNKIVFISPCHYKKEEAKKSKFVNHVIDYKELKKIIETENIKVTNKEQIQFDKFYNEYTRIYPLAGGLSKTAHLKGIISKKEIKVIDGINNIIKFLEKPNKKIKFLDCNFCTGGCIGGPCINSPEKLRKRKKRVIRYLKQSEKEDIPKARQGLIKKAQGISFKT
jgi:iron only hydrogenase large subunit-like protein